VVDDEPGVVALVVRFAQSLHFEVVTRSDARTLLAELPALHADVALVDRNMPEVGGLDILRAFRIAHPICQVILMTGDATVDSAIEAVKLGALDYLSKPLDLGRLGALLETVRADIGRRSHLLAMEADLAARVELCGMIGRSPVMQDLFDMVKRLAPHARTTLVTGETGTGKELVARALHALGPRRNKKFIAFNCSAVVETLFESELFGHARGAFTGAVGTKPGLFELADGGTLFLDEIAELPQAVQAKLLRVLENGEIQRVGDTDGRRVDIRLIAASNRRLVDEVAAGRFRQDLYYRLNVVQIVLPPLRERLNDIPYLTAAFVQEFAKRFNKSVAGVSPAAERLLLNAPWPGNVRELRNVLERACILSEGRLLSELEVLAALGGAAGARPSTSLGTGAPPEPARAAPPPAAAPALDRHHVERALQQSGGNRSAAAKVLGISRRTLNRRLDEFGVH